MRTSREVSLGVRLSKSEYEGLIQLAEQDGLSLSATLRRLLLMALRQQPSSGVDIERTPRGDFQRLYPERRTGV